MNNKKTPLTKSEGGPQRGPQTPTVRDPGFHCQVEKAG